MVDDAVDVDGDGYVSVPLCTSIIVCSKTTPDFLKWGGFTFVMGFGDLIVKEKGE